MLSSISSSAADCEDDEDRLPGRFQYLPFSLAVVKLWLHSLRLRSRKIRKQDAHLHRLPANPILDSPLRHILAEHVVCKQTARGFLRIRHRLTHVVHVRTQLATEQVRVRHAFGNACGVPAALAAATYHVHHRVAARPAAQSGLG